MLYHIFKLYALQGFKWQHKLLPEWVTVLSFPGGEEIGKVFHFFCLDINQLLNASRWTLVIKGNNWHDIHLFVCCVKKKPWTEKKKEYSASSRRWLANHYGHLMINGGQKIKFRMTTYITREDPAHVSFYMVERKNRNLCFFPGEKPDLSQIPLWDQWLTVTLLLNCRVQKELYCISP